MYKSMTTNLMVTDVDKSLSFYRDILHFNVINSVKAENGAGLQFAILERDGLMLMLQEKSNLTAEYPVLATEMLHPSVTLFIMVDDFEATYNKLKENCEVVSEIHTTFYGSKEFAVAAVDGYVLTFAEHTG
ncbi:MAG: VOC family protein [Streptococcaceae bacterium]|jgi:uncharacterized glyoxalase superfamily protein PhnB|nr:VOC family protein [Streptococcaceae bacterium]